MLSAMTIKFKGLSIYANVDFEVKLNPVHASEVLREEFCIPLGLSACALAKACDVPRTRMERIMREEMGISAYTALRLARYFGMSPDFWLKLQMMYELEVVGEAAIGALAKITPYVEGRAA
jgi:antitoxin HigA-1